MTQTALEPVAASPEEWVLRPLQPAGGSSGWPKLDIFDDVSRAVCAIYSVMEGTGIAANLGDHLGIKVSHDWGLAMVGTGMDGIADLGDDRLESSGSSF